MDAVLRYFWFLGAAFMAMNVAIWRARLRPLVRAGRLSAAEADGFIRGAALWLVVPPIALGIIGLMAGYPTPLCARVLSFRDAPSAATALVTLACWPALLWWIWVGDGAEFLARIGAALGSRRAADRSYSPRLVRLAVTATLLASGVGGVIMDRADPAPADRGCEMPRGETPRTSP